MDGQRIEHPAEFRADARLGRFGVTQLFGAITVAIVSLIAVLVMVMMQTSGWRTLLVTIAGTGITLEILFRFSRRAWRAALYAVRPRWRPADGSRPVTIGSDGTVQDLFKVAACSGPFVHFLDGYVAMVMRIQAPPSETLSNGQEELMVAHFQAGLKQMAEFHVEVTLYCDVEPDLNRVELERQQRQADRLSPESGLRKVIEARLAHHRELSQSAKSGSRMSYHVRLSVLPGDVPLAQPPADGQQYMAQAVTYLRDAGLALTKELEAAGLRVFPLAPEAIRDLAARQLDPAGWRTTEPSRGTDWSWPLGQSPAALRVVGAATVPQTHPQPEKPPAPAPASAPAWDRGAAAPGHRPAIVRNVLAVVGASPRAGATTIAVNLAMALRTERRRVAYLALDGGRNEGVTWMSGVCPLVSVRQWAEAAESVADDWAITGPKGIRLIPGPTRLPAAPFQPLRTETVSRMIAQVAHAADVVVLDLGADLDREQQCALGQATGVLVVTDPSTRQENLAYRVKQGEVAGIPRSSIDIIMNRAQGGCPVPIQADLVLPEDAAVLTCRRSGSIPVVDAPDSPWSQRLTQWVAESAYIDERSPEGAASRKETLAQ